MKSLLTSDSAWSRAVAVFGIILLISLGLCGVNYAAMSVVDGHPALNGAGVILIVTATLETIGILVGASGLVVTLIGAGLNAFLKSLRKP